MHSRRDSRALSQRLAEGHPPGASRHGDGAAALTQHPIGTRQQLDASTTFGAADACALLDPVAPALVGGSGPGLSGYGGWACHWRGTLADVVLDFFRYPPPGEAEFAALTVGGRAGMTRELGAICRVYVPQRTLPAADGSARTEYVRISVHGGRAADRCARASGVGERVVAALPPQR